jgi:hypothetical protein
LQRFQNQEPGAFSQHQSVARRVERSAGPAGIFVKTESTGKNGTGILPVVVEGVDAPGFADPGADAHRVLLGPGRPGVDATSVSGSLGAQFLLWEYATAVAGHILAINPFDQPNVA